MVGFKYNSQTWWHHLGQVTCIRHTPAPCHSFTPLAKAKYVGFCGEGFLLGVFIFFNICLFFSKCKDF